MMKVSKEAKVGILALITGVILYIGFNYLKGSNVFTTSNKFYATYDNVDGLVISNPVVLSGLNIGKVELTELQQEKGNQVRVTLSVQGNIKIPAGTEAILSDAGFLGGKLIKLKLGKSTTLLESGADLSPTKDKGISAILQEKAIPALANLDSLLMSMRVVMANLNVVTKNLEGTGLMLNGVLKNSDKTVTTLGASLNSTIADNKASLSGITSNLKTLSGNLIETEKGLKPLLGKFNSIADSLNTLKISKALASTQQSLDGLQKIMAGLSAGQGSAGKLLKDDSLYTNLNHSIANLDKLLIDFRLAPKRYINLSIFGKKTTPPPMVK
jgi:phospholipid/cholesterol/gamma-HCH transport system substrate-binding protein